MIDPVPGDTINTMSMDGNIIVYSSPESPGPRSVIALNTTTGDKLVDEPNASLNSIQGLAQTLVVEFSSANNVKTSLAVFDTEDGQLVRYPIEGSLKDLIQDGKLLVYQSSGNKGSSINLLDIPNNTILGEPITGDHMAVSKDGKTLVTRSEDNTITFWDVTKTWPFGDPLSKVPQKISAAAVSQDGSTFAWIEDKGVSLQALSTEKLISPPFMNHRIGTDSIEVGFIPNGKLVAIEEAPGERKTSTGKVSVAADVLESMQGMHPVIDLILEQRQLSKIKGTYLDALPKLVHPKTGRVHTSFNHGGG